jgi:hypothetical protein
MSTTRNEDSDDFDNLIKEIKLIIYSYLSYEDLCQVSLVNKKENTLASNLDLWNQKVKADFNRESTSNIHPKLFYKQLAMEQERDLFVAFHIGLFIDDFFDDHFDCSLHASMGSFYYCIKIEESMFSYLNLINTTIPKIINKLQNESPDEVTLFERRLIEIKKGASDQFNKLLTNPDEFDSKKRVELVDLLCYLDAHRTLGIVCKKSKNDIDFSHLLAQALCNFHVKTVKKLIELGADVNKMMCIPGDDDTADHIGSSLAFLLILLPKLLRMPTKEMLDKINEAASIPKITALFKLLLEHGADPDQVIYITYDGGKTQGKPVCTPRQFCQALSEEKDNEQYFAVTAMLKQIGKMVIESKKIDQKEPEKKYSFCLIM